MQPAQRALIPEWKQPLAMSTARSCFWVSFWYFALSSATCALSCGVTTAEKGEKEKQRGGVGGQQREEERDGPPGDWAGRKGGWRRAEGAEGERRRRKQEVTVLYCPAEKGAGVVAAYELRCRWRSERASEAERTDRQEYSVRDGGGRCVEELGTHPRRAQEVASPPPSLRFPAIKECVESATATAISCFETVVVWIESYVVRTHPLVDMVAQRRLLPCALR